MKSTYSEIGQRAGSQISPKQSAWSVVNGAALSHPRVQENSTIGGTHVQIETDLG